MGHSVAHLPMAQAWKGGKFNYEGILLYGAGQDTWGEDVVIEDYIDFKADLLITLKEPWCVPAETIVETEVGGFTIKEFIEEGLWRSLKVLSHEGFTRVKDTQIISGKKKLIEIKTRSGKQVKVTEDNLIYAAGKGWVLPTNLNIGDGVVVTSVCNRFEEVDKGRNMFAAGNIPSKDNACRGGQSFRASSEIGGEQGIRTEYAQNIQSFQEELERLGRPDHKGRVSLDIKRGYVRSAPKPSMVHDNAESPPYQGASFRDGEDVEHAEGMAGGRINRSGESVLSGDNRRRGVYRNIQVSPPKEQNPSLCDVLLDNKHIYASDGLVGSTRIQQNRDYSNPCVTKQQHGKEALLENHSWNQKSLLVNRDHNALSCHQTEASRNDDQVCQREISEAPQSTLRQRRDGIIYGEQAATSIEVVESIKEIPFTGLVYDLTTDAGNFFADNILIHNCFNHLYKYAINWVPITPVDHSPISPMMTSKLYSPYKVIAISRFGQKELRRHNIESVYIPHAVETNRFRPLERKAECKKMFYFEPDEFVVGIVARNQSRKMIPQMLKGYKRFREMNPDVKSHLMLWTHIMPPRPDEPTMGVSDVGVNLVPEIAELDLMEAVRWPDEKLLKEQIPDWAGDDYVAGWDMCKLMNSFDVLLNCTGGEGFSLTLIEAQSCGIPVITTDYASGPEQVGAGLTVRADNYVVQNTPGTRHAMANVDGMAEALTKILNADKEKLARRARRFAERYSWPTMLKDYWLPFLNLCEEELRPKITAAGVTTWN